jgi:hypothetical protein|uniref:Uncharacterized protein n=1 Tax=Caudovirales sp. ct7oE3 TaxID=2826768 RepID=A0A8S5LZK0_9CAUD|nr:MAG TPA: hypothetical protein [Caudovirales sp. ct7oE3]
MINLNNNLENLIKEYGLEVNYAAASYTQNHFNLKLLFN